MKLETRAYQQSAIDKLPGLLVGYRRVLAVAPTGSGKTVIGALLLKEMQLDRVLWVAHRIELLRQAYDSLLEAGIRPEHLGILSGPDKRNEDAKILVASVSMFRTRPVPDVALIVVDEAHRIEAASYQVIINAYPDAMVLGLTATPWRMDGKPLGETFVHMLVAAEQSDMIARGFIVKPVTYGLPLAEARAIVSGLKVPKGDYAIGELARAMMRRKLVGNVVSEFQRLVGDAPSIGFAASREHGKALCRRFSQARVAAEYVDGETPNKVRDAILGRLQSGQTQIVWNVDVLAEGFDCPPVKAIVMARPTRSLTRYLQQIGRASRPHGDRRPVVLDHAGNVWRFGLPDIDRPWVLETATEKPGTGSAPVRRCCECEAVIPAACRACPECNAIQPLSDREYQEQQALLEEIMATEKERAEAIERVRKVAKEKGADEAWVKKVLASMFGDGKAA